MAQISQIYPIINFSTINYIRIRPGGYLIGFDSNNSNLLSKIDNTGTITVIEGGGGSGIPGPPGPMGPAGPMGPQGPAGATGAMGPQGPQGLQGIAGPPGQDGADGPQGPQGMVGPRGLQGLPGATGPQGPAGATGAAGPQGPVGATGAAGPQGLQGLTGATGPQGPQGLQGPPGLDGAVGPQGPAGQDGAAGPQGPQGPPGEDGSGSNYDFYYQESAPTGTGTDTIPIGSTWYKTDNGNSYVYIFDTQNYYWVQVATQAPIKIAESTGFTRMTTAEINSIDSPYEGLTVYNTTLDKLCYYNGTSWKVVNDADMI